MSEEAQPVQEETKQRKSSLSRLIVIIVVVIVVVGAGYLILQGGGSLMGGGAVAIINGEKIARAQYNEYYDRLVLIVGNQGQDTSSTTIQDLIRKQAIEDLVVEKLLLQEAAKQGITASDEQTKVLFEQNKSQFQDQTAFAEALKGQGFTEDTFKAMLAKNVMIQSYLNTKLGLQSVTSTEEEVETLYDQLVAAGGGQDVPDLADARAQLEQEVVRQKQQALITQLIQELRGSSKVEILI